MSTTARHRIRRKGRQAGRRPGQVSLKHPRHDADIGGVNGVSVHVDETAASMEPVRAPAGLRRVAAAVTGLVRGRSSSRRDASLTAPSQDGWDEFHRELHRSRRYERHFAVVRVPCGVPSSGHGSFREPGADRYAETFERIERHLRLVDRAWVDGDSIYVMLPECDRSSAEAFVARLGRLVPDLLQERRIAMVSFPEDGATSGALVGALEGNPIAGTPHDVASAGSRAAARKLATNGDSAAGASS
ncbi:MAG: hypothetical protein U0R69_13055 [Gaiellales bacterium]